MERNYDVNDSMWIFELHENAFFLYNDNFSFGQLK